MSVIYDHLTAVLVGGIIILLIFNVQQRSQRVTVERTMMSMSKTSLLDLASYLERDLMNAGFETPPIETGILEHNSVVDGVTDTLLFWGVGESGARTRIAYGVAEAGTALIGGEEVPLYALRRYERQGSAFVQVGGSQPTLTQFRIDLLTSGGIPTDIATARQFKVRLASAVLPDADASVRLNVYRQLRWSITLSPPGLQ